MLLFNTLLVLYFGLTVSKYTDFKINICKKQLLAYFLMYTTTVNSLNRISIYMAQCKFIYLLVLYLRKKMHANNSIFCSDSLSHIQPSGIGWHIMSSCDFPTITTGLTSHPDAKGLYWFGQKEKKKPRGSDRWHLVSVNIQTRVYSVAVKCADLHTSFSGPLASGSARLHCKSVLGSTDTDLDADAQR